MKKLFYASWSLLLSIWLLPYVTDPICNLIGVVIYCAFNNTIDVVTVILLIISIGCFISSLIFALKKKTLISLIIQSCNLVVVATVIIRSINPIELRNILLNYGVVRFILNLLICMVFLSSLICTALLWIFKYIPSRRPTKAERLEQRIAELEKEVDDLKKGE